MIQFPRITRRQQEVLDTIVRLTERQGCSPTYQELADECGVTQNAAVQTVLRLMAHGRLRRLPHVPRSFEVVPAEGAS